MNVQAHMSGQVSGQVPNQTGTQLPVLPQQNGVPLSAQLQNIGNQSELIRARGFMQQKIYEILMRRRQPTHEFQAKKLKDIVRRLEEGLFRNATSQEEYMNFDTLESRLHVMIKGQPPQNQTFPQHNNASSIGTMIPTPGLSNGGNSNMMGTSSGDASMMSTDGNSSIASSTMNIGSSMATGNMVSGGLQNGFLSNGYQGGNNMISTMGVQRVSSQMIPTPGFSGNVNQSSVNMESTNVSHGFSTADTVMLTQQQQQPQKQHVGGQTSHILHTLGSQVGRQQKQYGFSNGSMNGGLGMITNNIQNVNGPGSSEGYLNAAAYGSSSKPSQQQFDQSQQSLMQGDGYGMNNTESSVSGNFYGNAAPMCSSMKSQNLNPTGMHSIPKTNSTLMTNQSSLHNGQQNANTKSQPVDQLEKMNFRSAIPSRETPMQQQRFQQQQQPHHYQLQQYQQQQLKQQQHMVKNEPHSMSHLNSDLGIQVKSEHPSELHNKVMHPQVSEQYQLSELQNQFQQKSDMQNHFMQKSEFPNQFNQTSQFQLMHPQQMIVESQKEFSSLTVGGKPESIPQGKWQDLPQDRSHASYAQHAEELSQRIARQDEAHHNNVSSNISGVPQTRISGNVGDLVPSVGMCSSVNAGRERSFINQKRWILFLKHAQHCTAPEGKCRDVNCHTAQTLLKHVDHCSILNCSYPRCHKTKILLDHYKTCKDLDCPVCVPVKSFLSNHRNSVLLRRLAKPALPVGSQKTDEDPSVVLSTKATSSVDASDDLLPTLKRVKTEQSSLTVVPDYGDSTLPTLPPSEPSNVEAMQFEGFDHGDVCPTVKSEFVDAKKEGHSNSVQENPMNEMTKDNKDDIYNQRRTTHPVRFDETTEFVNQEAIKTEKDIAEPQQENIASPAEGVTKSGKPKIKGVSLTELFTPDQVMQHINGLKQWVGQSKAKAEKNQAMEHSMTENSCQLCAVEKLTFEPPPIYCTPCGARIKRNAMYYTIGTGDTRNFFCISCYNDARGDSIAVDGSVMPKSKLEKKKNDEETEEWWVQCDKCEAWQHQICALFNGRRNDGGQAEYTCPKCYMKEINRGERKPLPQSAVLGAKDLPRTILSDHIEQRLFKRLKWERQERARVQGKGYDEVPSAEALVVRVVSSVDKKLEVKQRFLEIFQEENYPREFPYKSKVVLLFQKIEGVEVCLFGMYVQEFGAECQHPNQRRVYLSYLDSVKYFRPEIKAVTGEALRTFVYHEILIGYLEYCKKRGFTSCYIWACPPLKGEDYILYCHPEIQKTPKSDKLREWYLSMLRKASKENIVVDLTNLYDHFFTSTGECKAKVTASRLPYFDGDYWPGAAEDMIYQIQQEEEGRKLNKKGSIKKTITKRALKASGQLDLSANATKDLLLMHKLGETISPMKEDFIMVHLQHGCSHCCILMVSGNRWVCSQCKNFQLCDKCYEAEQERDDRERHPVHHKEKHNIYRVEIADVPVDTKDKDEILESEFFDTRQAFLSLCQGNHYQYDTLRRAKHSSMMVLYHLHNPTAPAFVTTCNVCLLDIEAGQGWRCEICPEYDVCNSCYQKGVVHQHALTNYPSNAERDAQNQEARQQRVLQLRKMLDLLVHASQCRSALCQYPNCRKVKGLFRHGITCKTRASGGCVVCKKMWYLLQLHARACKESECHVPRCRDLKIHMRRLQQQSDSRRRAAVMEMMRQRAAEVAGNS
uniref:histone acetyltransferase n=1 Tax=Kalanchoe fedtschenkoi TaxID=63787 RepID=A0A7N0TWK9_KALFE